MTENRQEMAKYNIIIITNVKAAWQQSNRKNTLNSMPQLPLENFHATNSLNQKLNVLQMQFHRLEPKNILKKELKYA